MNFVNTNPNWSLLILFAFLVHISCQKNTDLPIIAPSKFTKDQRTDLGEKIKIAFAFDDENFPVLPNIPPYDTTVYWFTQTLYNQVTNSLRIDNYSPSVDRWNLEKEWEIIILNMPEKNAFVIPGGQLYLTTGLLKALSSDYELYYILAFEAQLMNERYLFERLVSEFNTNVLSNIANGQPSPNGATSKTVAQAISRLDFAPEIVREIDALAAELICNSSRMNRLGLIPLLDQSDEDWIWFNTRTTYSGRVDYIRDEIGKGLNCGSFETSGGYRRYVLNHL